MIYARVLLAAFVVLAVIYYVMVIGQLFGKWKITNREIKFSYLCIPSVMFGGNGSGNNAMDAVGLKMLMNITKSFDKK